MIPRLAIRPVNLDGMRFYEYEGALYPSVTTILSVVAKPELQRWAIRTALRELINSIGSGPVSRQELLVLAARAAAAPERIRDEAAQRGRNIIRSSCAGGKGGWNSLDSSCSKLNFQLLVADMGMRVRATS